MKSFTEFLQESENTPFVDSKTKPLEKGKWYHYSKSGEKIQITDVHPEHKHFTYKESNSDGSMTVSRSVYHKHFKGYLTQAGSGK